MVEIVWQDPPARNKDSKYQYQQIIDELKKNPGRWALVVPEWSTSVAPSPLKKAGCETTTRFNGKDAKTWSVYARWPEKQPDKAAPPAAVKRSAGKEAVDKAIATGTALKPPANANLAQKTIVENDPGGLNKYLAGRRARGAPMTGV